MELCFARKIFNLAAKRSVCHKSVHALSAEQQTKKQANSISLMSSFELSEAGTLVTFFFWLWKHEIEKCSFMVKFHFNLQERNKSTKQRTNLGHRFFQGLSGINCYSCGNGSDSFFLILCLMKVVLWQDILVFSNDHQTQNLTSSHKVKRLRKVFYLLENRTKFFKTFETTLNTS